MCTNAWVRKASRFEPCIVDGWLRNGLTLTPNQKRWDSMHPTFLTWFLKTAEAIPRPTIDGFRIEPEGLGNPLVVHVSSRHARSPPIAAPFLF